MKRTKTNEQHRASIEANAATLKKIGRHLGKEFEAVDDTVLVEDRGEVKFGKRIGNVIFRRHTAAQHLVDSIKESQTILSWRDESKRVGSAPKNPVGATVERIAEASEVNPLLAGEDSQPENAEALAMAALPLTAATVEVNIPQS